MIEDKFIEVQNQTPKIVEEEDGTTMTAFSSLQPQQVEWVDGKQYISNATNQKDLQVLDIKMLSKVGAGAQGEVFEVKIENIELQLVSKYRKILNNVEMANKVYT